MRRGGGWGWFGIDFFAFYGPGATADKASLSKFGTELLEESASTLKYYCHFTSDENSECLVFFPRIGLRVEGPLRTLLFSELPSLYYSFLVGDCKRGLVQDAGFSDKKYIDRGTPGDSVMLRRWLMEATSKQNVRRSSLQCILGYLSLQNTCTPSIMPILVKNSSARD